MLHSRHFATYNVVRVKERGVHGRLLAKVSIAGKLTGSFRFIFGSRDLIGADFSANQLFLEPELAAWDFYLECRPADLTFPANRAASKWIDVITAVQEGHVQITNTARPEDGPEVFQEKYERAHEEAEVNACWRWILEATEDKGVYLVLQGLPVTAASAESKPSFEADASLGIPLYSVPVIFDAAEHLDGPAPVFFSDQPAATGQTFVEQVNMTGGVP